MRPLTHDLTMLQHYNNGEYHTHDGASGEGGTTTGTVDDDSYNDAILTIQNLLAEKPWLIQLDARGWLDPQTGRVHTLDRKADGTAYLRELTISDSAKYRASVGNAAPSTGGGGGGSGGGSAVTDDPRYWENQQQQNDIEWAQLDQNERQEAERLAFQYQQAGMDAETARRNALAQLIQNRNDNSINLARTSADVAKTAAEFAARPADAYAEMNYRNATGTGPAFGSIGGPQFQQYGNALDEKFNDLFGGVAGDLSRAREYVNSIPPTEYFGAETRQQLGLPLLPQQELAGFQPPNPLEGLVSKLQGMSAPDQEAFRRYTDPAYRERQSTIEGAYAADPVAAKKFFEQITAMNGGVRPAMAEDGINMNIHEPAAVVGMSGKIYATMAEKDPEQLRVIPLPSVKKARAEDEKRMKERQKSGASAQGGDAFHQARQQFLEQTQGAQRMSGGGTIRLTGPIGVGRSSGDLRGAAAAAGLRSAQYLADGGKLRLSNRNARRGTGTRTPGSPNRTPTQMPIGNNPQGGITPVNFNDPVQYDAQGYATGVAPGKDLLSSTRNNLAMFGAETPQGQALPDPRMLSNEVLSRAETDPIWWEYIKAAYAKQGINPATLEATIKQYRPTGLNTGGGVPKVSFR